MALIGELEFRDYNFNRCEEYWRVRARCLAHGLPCLGTKEQLIEKFAMFAFNSETNIAKSSPDELEKWSDVALEKYASPSWLSKRYNIEGNPHTGEHDLQLATKHPWKVVPEISYMNKKIASDDVLRAVGALMRPTMCFYNHVPDCGLSERLVAIIFLPFTAEFAWQAPEGLIRHLASALSLKNQLENQELRQAVERQKLLELAYSVQDSEALHGVGYCQTHFSVCRSVASSLCANFMCPGCCPLHQFRRPCHIHDRYLQFLRHTLRALSDTESSLQASSTLRLRLKQPLRKVQLYRAFEGVAVVIIHAALG